MTSGLRGEGGELCKYIRITTYGSGFARRAIKQGLELAKVMTATGP